MNKPKWINNNVFAAFIDQYKNESGIIHCVQCNASEESVKMTVDHIVPRIKGGNDFLTNLQPMCLSCNSRKRDRPDTYWNRRFYFDLPIDKANLRASQSDFVMSPVEDYCDFFSQPYSNINGKLFTYIQGVGAGKSLGMFALPFALNSCSSPGSTRIDRVLMITKDQTLRNQLARELEDEPVDYGIISEPPRVKIIEGGHMMSDNVDDHDIAVMCPQLLWPKIDINDDIQKAEWHVFAEDMLNRYPLIIFDEMHYAYSNIGRMLRTASNSLVFGFTASPIDSAGGLLDDMVLMSIFSYDDAQINDGSMKFINLPSNFIQDDKE
jgi:hypothetical protein